MTILANANHQPLDQSTVQFVVPDTAATKVHGEAH
jgi:hypothetical protein